MVKNEVHSIYSSLIFLGFILRASHGSILHASNDFVFHGSHGFILHSFNLHASHDVIHGRATKNSEKSTAPSLLLVTMHGMVKNEIHS